MYEPPGIKLDTTRLSIPDRCRAYRAEQYLCLRHSRRGSQRATHRAEALMSQKRFDAKLIHTHSFALEDLPTALRYARDRVNDAIKVVVKTREGPTSPRP